MLSLRLIGTDFQQPLTWPNWLSNSQAFHFPWAEVDWSLPLDRSDGREGQAETARVQRVKVVVKMQQKSEYYLYLSIIR